jgi:hypothetical protein
MSLNFFGGIAAVAALGAIFYFGTAKPEPTVIHPTPAPKADPADPVVYHRVEQNGKQGPETQCSSVKLFAEGKSPAELAAYAKQYSVTVDEVKRFYVCTPN